MKIIDDIVSYKLLMYLGIILFLYSCNSNETNKKQNFKNKYKITIKDSINLDASASLNIMDYYSRNGSFAALQDSSISVFDFKGNRNSFNHFGRGPHEYYFPFYLNFSIHFVDDQTLVVNSMEKLKYYNVRGEYKKSKKRFDKVIKMFPRIIVGHKFVGSDTLFVFNGKVKTSIGIDLSNSKAFDGSSFGTRAYFVNCTNDSITEFAPLKKESVLFNNPKMMINSGPIQVSSYNMDRDSYDLLFSEDFKLFRYGVKDTSIYHMVDMQPDYIYKQNLIDVKDIPSSQQINFHYLSSSFYSSFNSIADTLIAAYIGGYGDHKVRRSLPAEVINWDQCEEYKELVQNRHTYIQYFVNEKKQCVDIEVPLGYNVLYVGDPHHILLERRDCDLIDGDKPIRRVYRAELQKM
ncbi:MAG: hypothetical protein ACEPOW_11085 [Bacteroidales bacterium]